MIVVASVGANEPAAASGGGGLSRLVQILKRRLRRHQVIFTTSLLNSR